MMRARGRNEMKNKRKIKIHIEREREREEERVQSSWHKLFVMPSSTVICELGFLKENSRV